MKCIGDHILIVPDKEEENKTDYGIILTTQKMQSYATVYCDCDYNNLKKGDRIVYNPTIGYDIQIESDKVRSITPKEVIAVL